MKNKNNAFLRPREEEEVVEKDTSVESPKKERKIGMVANCEKLRLRSAPNTGDNVIAELNCGTVLSIDEENSTGGFYKVRTNTGVEGYCMKPFVDLD